jgi:SAM-dependent methyltransferase
MWDAETAERYDETSASMFDPDVLDPVVDFLANLARDGHALEFAIGTGRVALPLIDRGIPVSGIELSQPMTDQLLAKRADVPVLVGDMATARVPGAFALVYVVWNSIGNLRTQAEQVACFRNAAAHLAPGGRFVIELWVPGIRRLPPGQQGVPFHIGDHHLGLDTYDLTTQQGTSHHYTRHDNGTITYSATNFRYIWPAECDLMAELAGLTFEGRFADWHGSAFTSDSESHVSVWRKP